MALPQAKKVRAAEINEYTSHLQNGTSGTALEPGQRPGECSQGVFDATRFAFQRCSCPVPAVTSFRVFMLGVASQGRSLAHLDVKTAFWTTPMDCQVDVTLPEAFNSEKGFAA